MSVTITIPTSQEEVFLDSLQSLEQLPELSTADELAVALRTTKRVIGDNTRAGLLVGWKLGRGYTYPKRNVARWIALRLPKSAISDEVESDPQAANYWGRPARTIGTAEPRGW